MLSCLRHAVHRRPLHRFAPACTVKRHAVAESKKVPKSDVTLDEILEAATDEEKLDELKSSVSGQQGILWFANIYPTKAFRFDFRQSLTHHNHTTLIPRLLPDGVEVLRMIPREREGGAFVFFRAPPNFVLKVLVNLAKNEPKTGERFMKKGNVDVLATVSMGVSKYLKTHPIQAFLCPHPVRAYPVKGEPFFEDLDRRYPSSTLRIRLEPGADSITEEELYSVLRPFGLLNDLEALPDGNMFKANFAYAAAAAAARNCLHRSKIASVDDGTEIKMHISFEPFMQKFLWDTIISNARYAIPLISLLLMGLTFLVLDPMRAFFVRVRIARAMMDGLQVGDDYGQPVGVFDMLLQAISKWNQAQTQFRAYTWGNKRRNANMDFARDFWSDRNDEVDNLRPWLVQNHGRLTLLTGSRGNGQNAFVRHVVQQRAIFVDVEPMLEAEGAADDSMFLRQFSRSFGYSPAPIADRQLNALLDLILPGTGKLSRENELLTAIQRVLAGVTQALVALSQRRGEQPDATLPLFVVEGFTSENKDRREGFFDLLVQWSAYVCEKGLARVLFIADSSFAEPAILTALKERPERLDVEQLPDADRSFVRRVLHRQLGESKVCTLTEEDLGILGSKFRDLLSLVDEVRAGEEPGNVVRQMVEASSLSMRTLLATGQPGAKWTRPQLWRAMRIFAACRGDSSVPYDIFLWSVFRGDESALRSMSQSNLIIVDHRGRRVLPGSSVYAEVFRRLVQQEGFAAVLDLEVAKEDIKREQDTVETYEAQLVKLQEVDDIRREKGRSLPDPNEALRKRKEQLLSLILEQHGKLEKYHRARRDASAVIQRRIEDIARMA